MMDDWEGFDLICPDLPSSKSMFLRGEQVSSLSDVFAFTIDKCVEGRNAGVVCKSKTEIEEYIKDVQIETWEVS